jgi:hypothetical protein
MRFRAAGLILRRPALFALALRVAWRPVLSLPNASSAAIARSIRPFSPCRSLTSLAVSIFSFPFYTTAKEDTLPITQKASLKMCQGTEIVFGRIRQADNDPGVASSMLVQVELTPSSASRKICTVALGLQNRSPAVQSMQSKAEKERFLLDAGAGGFPGYVSQALAR